MNELVIDKVETIEKHSMYIADIYIVKGKIMPNEVWQYKNNPKIKIKFKSPAIISSHKKNEYLVNYTFFKPDFDLKLLSKPTSWIKAL